MMPIVNGSVNIYQDVDLSLTESVVAPVVHVRQYDDRARKVRCTLYSNHLEYQVPQEAILMYLGTRPDGCIFQYSTENASNDKIALDGENHIILTVTEYMTEVAGRFPVDVVLLDSNDDVLGSFSFILSVEAAAGRVGANG